MRHHGGRDFSMHRCRHLPWGSMHSAGQVENCEVHWVLQDHLPPQPFAQRLQDVLQRPTQPRQVLWHCWIQASSSGSGSKQTSSWIKPQGSSSPALAALAAGGETGLEVGAVGAALPDAAGGTAGLGAGVGADGDRAGAGSEVALGSAGSVPAVLAPHPPDAASPNGANVESNTAILNRPVHIRRVSLDDLCKYSAWRNAPARPVTGSLMTSVHIPRPGLGKRRRFSLPRELAFVP